MIEYHRRLALPTACIVLALVGIPLGLSSKRGGKSTGFVLTILLVFLYYSISLIGVSLARQGRLSPAAGVWIADLAFLVGGAFLLWRSERRPIEIAAFRSWFKLGKEEPGAALARRDTGGAPLARRGRMFNLGFPTILDDYVLRDFTLYLSLIVATFVMLLLVFTLFELVGDILRNQVSPLLVGEYLLNVTPYFLYYPIAPLSMLIAVLVTFGLLQRSNEITAIKATGISLYRIVIPVLLAAAVVAGSLFFPTSSICPTPTNARTRSATASRASPRRPTCAPTASGSSARTPISTTTSSSIPIATFSAASRCSSSILTLSRSGTASPPSARTGPVRWAGGFTSRDGSGN